MNRMELIEKIKEKKELSDLPDFMVDEFISKYFHSKNISLSQLNEKDLKEIVKESREFLRRLTGRFQKSQKLRLRFSLEGNYTELLKTHSSTNERMDFYPELKDLISSLNVSSILDLGCGLNPLALASRETEYYASDIKESELSIISDFFKKEKIKGKAFVFDLRKDILSLPKADLCIIFKVLDFLQKESPGISGKILDNVRCKYFLISFATRKLSGRAMKFPERKWFENLLARKNLSFKKFKSDNELFYLVENSSIPKRD